MLFSDGALILRNVESRYKISFDQSKLSLSRGLNTPCTPEGDFGPFGDHLGALLELLGRSFGLQIAPRVLKSGLRALKMAPRELKNSFYSCQEYPRSLQVAPKGSQETPKRLPRGSQGGPKVVPRGSRGSSGRSPRSISNNF